MKTRALQELPEGYGQLCSFDLKKDKKINFIINLAAVLIIAVMALIMAFFRPVSSLIIMDSLSELLIKYGVLIASLIAYIVLHELTHAAAMKHYGSKKVRFGYTGLYAFAGSEGDYFPKKAYIVISLAPLVVWALIFSIILMFVPDDWFWFVYILQIANVSGAAGDMYFAAYTLRQDRDVLVKDTGVNMTYYGVSEKKEETDNGTV